LHGIFTFKIVGHIFWHRLMAAAKITMGYSDTGVHIGGYCTYCDLHYLDGGASYVQNFFLAVSQFDWLGPPPKNLNL
jgi:hypothetical protein